ncbi:FAD-dependent oxidoreductase [Halodesulfurarchaeum sp. HSR-GB]|uniref:oxidoreductase n=1 Tax=Halodesulfurarchaeum sp. HSR-GB TaxID=3074077 RepID=UPI00285B9044|nr:FAD-dependent oxidoreductase [Halodesulfurarchaeum sp. HSR-GB]MDR5655947.1 FAD-dependent oxidoreductase [Halodesulfurarchaeum sp. HSR-GB]
MDLQQEVEIVGTPISNRAVFRAVRTNLAENGHPTEELNEHLAARARGGVGLVVGPAKMLVDSSASGPWFVDAYDTDVVPALERTARSIHEAGGTVFGQLTHPGAEATGDWEMQAQLAPSAVASDSTYEMPTPMSHDDIERLQRSFGTAAKNLSNAGFDGVELAAGPYSILRQFLSPKFNVREDEYGGSWENRARFVNEVLDTVSKAIDEPVGLHLSLAEMEYGGYEYEDIPDLLNAIDGFDYLSVTVGTASTYTQGHSGIGMDSPGLESGIETVSDIVDVPLIGRSPLTTGDSTRDLLDAGADLVSFTRQLLADENTVQKLQEGVRPKQCIKCNQKCLEGVFADAHGGHVECVINPRTGREAELDPIQSLPEVNYKQNILVVGGGPAGMRFATVASQRGHNVTLRERKDKLGGQLTVAAQGILSPIERALEDLKSDLIETEVAVETGQEVRAKDISNEWDAIVVATGAPISTKEGYDFEEKVVDAVDVLQGEETADEVLLIDENRWIITMQVGLELARRGTDLEIVTEDHYPGFRTEQPNLPTMVASLQAQGVDFIGNHEVDEITDDGTVTMHHIYSGTTQSRKPETIVYAGRRSANESLYLELSNGHDDVYRIGDAVSPRKLDRAYYDAEDLARRL